MVSRFPWISGDLEIEKSVMDEIEQHALECYPSESCGFRLRPGGSARAS